ncbi:MAG: alpha/beta fold hydrolase [Proteobacteria bacterium]|nr:alpha/beta fold hydrolase [Pseudomonadota bacterium]
MSTTFVLIHGAWHGGWCWDRVRPLLEVEGHRVLTPTLTGLGERAHLLSPAVGLHTHVDDVVTVLRDAHVGDCVLVGHSYAGITLNGVIDRLHGGAAPHVVPRQLIYLDSVIAGHGERWCDMQTPEQVAARMAIREISANGTPIIPAPSPQDLGIDLSADQDAVSLLLTPHPFRCYVDVLDAPYGADASIRRTYIDCTAPALGSLALSKRRAREEGLQMVPFAAGHDCMFSAPAETADLLLATLT